MEKSFAKLPLGQLIINTVNKNKNTIYKNLSSTTVRLRKLIVHFLISYNCIYLIIK